MPNIVIKDENGNPETYENVNTVKFKTPDDSTVSFKYNTGEDYQRIDPMQFCVRFIDYDGFVLREMWVDEGDAITEYPPSPSHAGLQFVGWNYTLAELSNITSDYDVGACYKGDPVTQNTEHTTYFFAIIPAVTRNFGLRLYGTGANKFTIDWGDGSTSTINRTTQSATTASTASHTYAAEYAGQEVTIKLTKTEGAGTYWFGYTGTQTSYVSYCVIDSGKNMVSKIVLAEDISELHKAAFYQLMQMETIIIPNAIDFAGDRIFYDCSKLRAAIIPRGVSTFGAYTYSGCDTLERFSFPETVMSFGERCFYDCYNLKSVCFPHSVTDIPSYTLYGCYNIKRIILPSALLTIAANAFSSLCLESIVIPASVSSIGNNAFSANGCLLSVTMKGETPPALGTTVFQTFVNTRPNFIYVPNPAAYQAEPSWENYAPYVLQG